MNTCVRPYEKNGRGVTYTQFLNIYQTVTVNEIVSCDIIGRNVASLDQVTILDGLNPPQGVLQFTPHQGLDEKVGCIWRKPWCKKQAMVTLRGMAEHRLRLL